MYDDIDPRVRAAYYAYTNTRPPRYDDGVFNVLVATMWGKGGLQTALYGIGELLNTPTDKVVDCDNMQDIIDLLKDQ